MEEINDAEANREMLLKLILENDFVSCVQKAKFEIDMTQVSSLISKAKTLKRRSEELNKLKISWHLGQEIG